MALADQTKGDGDHGLGNHPVACLNIAALPGGASITDDSGDVANEYSDR